MSDDFEKMTLKQAVEAHEKAQEIKRKKEAKKQRANAAKNMAAKPDAKEQKNYTLQNDIARQVQEVMSGVPSGADRTQDTVAKKTAVKGKQVKAKAASKGKSLPPTQMDDSDQELENALAAGVRELSGGKQQADKGLNGQSGIGKTQDLAADTRQLRQQIANRSMAAEEKKDRSEAEEWLMRKHKSMEKRNDKKPEQDKDSREISPEEIDDKKLRFLFNFGEVGKWFQTLCWLHIPILGFLYILVMAIRRKTPPQKRNFAIAWILYRLLVWVLALTLLYILYQIGLDFVDQILQYVGKV